MEKHIAVVSSDISDFKTWLLERNMEGKSLDSRKQVKIDDTTYHCVYKPTHTISMVYDSIVETNNAKKSGAYSSTLTHTKRCLKG
jgi:hypothetical protein